MLKEEQLYQGVYNGIASNIDTNYVNDNSVRKYGSHSSAVADEYVDLQDEGLKQKVWDDDVSFDAVKRANKNLHEESNDLALICNAIENLQRRVSELEDSNKSIADIMYERSRDMRKLDDRLHEVERGNFVGIPMDDSEDESSIGCLSGYDGSGDKELNIPVKLDDKGIDFFAGLKDIAKATDKDKKSDKSDKEEKVLPDSDEDDSAMGRPFCKVVKGKVLKQDLYKGVGINEYKFPKSATYRIDYMHFFRNMYKWGAFDGFEVQLLSSNQPIVRERALLCLGNIDFAIVTIESRDRNQEGFYSIMVDNIRLIPSFFKLGKIFGAKTYPEFMDAIEVKR